MTAEWRVGKTGRFPRCLFYGDAYIAEFETVDLADFVCAVLIASDAECPEGWGYVPTTVDVEPKAGYL